MHLDNLILGIPKEDIAKRMATLTPGFSGADIMDLAIPEIFSWLRMFVMKLRFVPQGILFFTKFCARVGRFLSIFVSVISSDRPLTLPFQQMFPFWETKADIWSEPNVWSEKTRSKWSTSTRQTIEWLAVLKNELLSLHPGRFRNNCFSCIIPLKVMSEKERKRIAYSFNKQPPSTVVSND